MRDSVDDHVDRWVRELPSLDPLREQVIARISKVARHVSVGRSTALAAGDLAVWQFKTLLMLRRVGKPYELSPSALADLLGLTRFKIEQVETIGERKHGAAPSPQCERADGLRRLP